MNIKELIAKKAASKLKRDTVVNLGIGIPTLVAKYIDSDVIHLHTENGLLGVSELTDDDEVDPLRVNAGKLVVGENIGASYFDSATSFAMIRGGHVDTAILGALEVDENGLVANWAIPGRNIMGVGGAMDLLSGSKKIIVTSYHTSKNGESKFVKNCSFPVTSNREIDMFITDLAVFKRNNNKWWLIELMPGQTIKEVRENTKASFEIAEDLKEGKIESQSLYN